jgi:hypothetical protein
VSQYYTLVKYRQAVDKTTGEPKKDKYGNIAVYADFEGVNGSVYWKVQSIPEPNKRYYGRIEQGEYGAVFRKEMDPNAQSSGFQRPTPKARDNDGQRQGMCINNAANFVSVMAEFAKKPLTKEEWATQVYEYASALYAKGDLGKLQIVDAAVSGNEDIAQLLGQVD